MWTGTHASDVTLKGVTGQFGLTARAVRYYEEVGLIVTRRDPGNRRRFDPRAVSQLRIIAELRRAGLGIDDIRVALQSRPEAGDARLDVSYAVSRLHERLANLEQERRTVEATLEALTSTADAS
ncbi:MerR family transcriptional regulator [Phenylobacterium sp.]|uniref:MerR family transcriptional regulator n=1 Tax=Phenylobacterium sp. TaxID=1871053 RepID=UPI0027311B40|nr:MerR family transcriptional regulator [Phenylobacterium sp.]MDP1599991.1 MerR family transcriptional regulator [Phenylobacterium sp.]MDP3593934.1 MerR family transcriptional regulator [Phenylobacterium sp.]